MFGPGKNFSSLHFTVHFFISFFISSFHHLTESTEASVIQISGLYLHFPGSYGCFKTNFSVHFYIFYNFNMTITPEISTLHFEQNCIFSSISQSILNGLPSNLHKVGSIFSRSVSRAEQLIWSPWHVFVCMYVCMYVCVCMWPETPHQQREFEITPDLASYMFAPPKKFFFKFKFWTKALFKFLDHFTDLTEASVSRILKLIDTFSREFWSF